MYGLIKLQDIIIIVNPPPPPLGQYYHNRTFNEHAMILAPSMSFLCSTMKETQRRPSHRRRLSNNRFMLDTIIKIICIKIMDMTIASASGRRVNSTLQNTE